MYEHCVMEHLAGTLPLSRYPKSSCDLICIWYLLSADSRPFLRHLTFPPLSPDTYESLVLAYLGIFLFDTDHLDIADRSAIDI